MRRRLRAFVFYFAQTPWRLLAQYVLGRGATGGLPMNDAQRYRMNAAECLSAAERCEQPYRRLTLAIAETWLSLARHEEAMDALLGSWSTLPSASSDVMERAR
jgi:hypothetical protein